jgi:hypothetical protein
MTDSNITPTNETRLFKALTIMLKPLVRLLIRQNITYVGLQSLLKRTFVEVAEEHFQLQGKRLTDSRISLLTGVHRGDVKRIREETTSPPTDKEIKASVSAQIMAVWLGNKDYLDERQQPKILYRNKKDGDPNFEELALSVSKDKHPRSILDEWLAQGIVTSLDNDRLQLNKSGYVPSEDVEEKLFFAGKTIGSHLSVVAYNLENKSPPMFDRTIFYHGLSAESVKKVEQLSKEKMMIVLTEINQLASQLQESDQTTLAPYHFQLGAYFQRDESLNDTLSDKKA